MEKNTQDNKNQIQKFEPIDDQDTKTKSPAIDDSESIDTNQPRAEKKSFISKNTKEEITELIKPIAIHEAKSALYKAKLAGYVLQKGAIGAGKAAKFIGNKSSEIIEKQKKKRTENRKAKK